MEDKILDDDDIIDLTDLLEEGEPKGRKAKKEAEPPARIPLNEPDSFDLGKEISMEYDVSVEEIEQGGESLDIDASLSSGEEIALSPESGEGEEIVLSQEPEGEIEFDFGDAEPEKKKSKEAPHRKQLEEISVEDPGGSTFEMDDDLSAAAGSGLEKQTVERTTEDAGGDALQEFPEDAGAAEPLVIQDQPADRSAEEIGKENGSAPVPGEAQGAVLKDVLGGLRQEIPGMLEEMVRPIMSELVRELVASTREQLPGIIEKVIREEIEKLKKLDS